MAPRPTKTKAAKATTTDNPRESKAGPADGTLPSAGRGEAGEPNSEARAAGSAEGQIAQPEPDAGAQAAKVGGPETPPANAAETGESKGEDAAASPELDKEPVSTFDPAILVRGLEDEQMLRLAIYIASLLPADFAERLPELVQRTEDFHRMLKDERTRDFVIGARVKISRRYIEPGTRPLTRKEHAVLHTAGIISADWPD
ncbi:Uncharacterised protein [Starkeya nomas]|uniref:Uncharacterized protein n=1 Tax=Starkeya nomas TaxID=2666134 RepID=A0A5S9PBW1_9HYPH|nr:hypothetical protein [Starkeya nomas]CAA0101265.1 Uncharacterised protein [Starkeya nomas]